MEGAEPVAVPSPRGMARAVLATLTQPRPLAREAVRLGANTVRIVRGTDQIAPAPRDRRFADPAWSLHPGYRRLAKSYLAVTASLTGLVDAYEADGADWREVEQARFFFNAFTSALSPTNTLLGNPAAVKRAFETGGRSLSCGEWATCSTDLVAQRRSAHPGRPQRVRRRHEPGDLPGCGRPP